MSSLLSYVWLSLKRGLGNYLRAEVLRRMGSPEAVYAADSTMLAQSCPSLRRQHIELLCDKSTDEAEQVITQCAREDIRILPVSDAAYPDRLRQIEDPPVVLYIRGRWPDFDTMPGIAVVGTRQATSYGVQVAGTIGAELAKAGFVTVRGVGRVLACLAKSRLHGVHHAAQLFFLYIGLVCRIQHYAQERHIEAQKQPAYGKPLAQAVTNAAVCRAVARRVLIRKPVRIGHNVAEHQLFLTKVSRHLGQVMRMVPLPLGVRTTWPHLGHLKKRWVLHCYMRDILRRKKPVTRFFKLRYLTFS